MVGEAIEKRAGEPLGPEHARPFIEWQVAGDERGAAFIALAEHFEEQLRTNGGKWHVAQFADNQQLDRVEMLLQRPQAAVHGKVIGNCGSSISLKFVDLASHIAIGFGFLYACRKA